MREAQDFIEVLGEEVHDVDEGTRTHYVPVASYANKTIQKRSTYSPGRIRPKTWAW